MTAFARRRRRTRGKSPMPYVDGFIVAVPKKKLEAYVRLSKKVGKVGKLTSFPRSVKLKPGETVVFAWITYKSRAQRDKINAKVMADPRLKSMTDEPSPFDGKRLIYGGFESLVKV